MGKFSVLALVLASVLVLGTVNMINNVSAQTDVWYPGEGVTQDMYVKYEVEDYDTNNREPFLITLYFQEQQEDGSWIVPTYVEANTRVYEGTLRLAETMAPLAGGEIPPEMNQFVSGYQNSLQWMDAVTTMSDPQSLTARSWGQIAAIGGEEIIPQGTEQVSFQGAEDVCGSSSCEATLISWRKGVDSRVWIVNEFPFPVMAEAYVDVTVPPHPLQYGFELLETGLGQPEAPVGTAEVPSPPLERTTNDGSRIRLAWDPIEIEPGTEVNFGLTLNDARGTLLQQAAYDFTITDANGQVVQEFTNQLAPAGSATHQVTFDNAGPMTIVVQINSVGGMPTGTIVQTADFGIVVVPEFPAGAAIAAAVVIGLIITMTRARSTNLGSTLFGTRGAP